jgi:3-oxoacyl-[acyl-carrier protein] reductase
MTYDFNGKVALVTGASRGIGRGIALELARNGASIAGIYVANLEMAEKTLEDIVQTGAGIEFFKCDVSREDDVLAVKEKVIEKFGRVDFVINNAGVHQHLKSWELSIEDWKRIIDINLTGVFVVSKAFIPHMRERKCGKIVNISSCAAYTGTDHEVHYAASKAGIIGLTKSLALELASYNINVNAIAPGYIDTDMVVFESEVEKKDVENGIPKGRIGIPEDIAKTVSFLCSEDADYITGQMLHVNGGLVMP